MLPLLGLLAFSLSLTVFFGAPESLEHVLDVFRGQLAIGPGLRADFEQDLEAVDELRRLQECETGSLPVAALASFAESEPLNSS